MSTAVDVTFRQDTAIWPLVEDLAACLCKELVDSNLPDACFCGILPGEVAMDYVGDGSQGQAWVRVVGIYPSSAFPAQETGSRLSCEAPLAAELELGVFRCAPVSQDGVTPSTQVENWEVTRLLMADMAAMRRAVQCCYSGSKLIRLGRYAPVGPMGMVMGGTWQVFVSEAVGRRG